MNYLVWRTGDMLLKNFRSDLSLCLVNRKERFRHECKRVRGNKLNVNEWSEKGKTHNYFTKVLVPAGEVEMPRVLLGPLWCFGALALWCTTAARGGLVLLVQRSLGADSQNSLGANLVNCNKEPASAAASINLLNTLQCTRSKDKDGEWGQICFVRCRNGGCYSWPAFVCLV